MRRQLVRLLNFTEAGHNDTIFEERADVAQLVEQLIRNQQVIGSSPIVGSIRHSPTAILLPPSDTPRHQAKLPEGYGLPRRSKLQAIRILAQ